MSDTLPNEVREKALLEMKLAPWPLRNDNYADRDKYVGKIFDAALSALEAAGWKCVRDEGAYPRAFVEFVLRHTWPERAKAHGHEAVHDIIKNHPFAQMYAPASASNPKEKPMGSPQDIAQENTNG